jgi:hypothetical protein
LVSSSAGTSGSSGATAEESSPPNKSNKAACFPNDVIFPEQQGFDNQQEIKKPTVPPFDFFILVPKGS